MRHNRNKVWMAMAMILALVIGAAALAEGAVPEQPSIPAEETAPETPAASADDAALQEAMKALREARQASHQAELEDELKAFVEAGKLTQEQADLILNAWKTCQDQKSQNGDCGKFNGGKRGGKANGGMGGNQPASGNRGMGGMGGKHGSRQNMNSQNAPDAPAQQPETSASDGI